MSAHFAIFGIHPKLSLAELISVYPDAAKPQLVCDQAAVFQADDWDGEVAMNQLGGTVKLGDILLTSKVQSLKLKDIADQLIRLADQDKEPRTPDSKRSLDFGWTVYGTGKQKQILEKFPIKIKQELSRRGFSVRWVTGPRQSPLSPAAVAKCKLTQSPNADLCAFVNGDEVIIGRTTHVQDADAWSKRDYGRPYRDDENGMLPPKLARMMVNLADVKKGQTVLDPFCGSGTVLMEACLATQAATIIGSDIEAQQVKDTQDNLDWLERNGVIYNTDQKRFKIFQSDVRQIAKHLAPKSVDAVVTEGWLGPPLRGSESLEQLKANADAVTDLWTETFVALKKVLKPGARLIVIAPSFKTAHGVARVNLQAVAEAAGLHVEKPLQALGQDVTELVYHREGQRVMRRILVLTN